MPLNESNLSAKIIKIIDVINKEEIDADKVKKRFADDLAKAIVSEVKAATVTGVCPTNGGALINGKIN